MLNMEKKDIKIVVYESDQYNHDDWPSCNALEYIGWFQDKLDTVPEEFRDKVDIDVDSEPSWGDSTTNTICITYWRQETDGECEARFEKAAKKEEERLKVTELRDLQEYKRLQTKYANES